MNHFALSLVLVLLLLALMGWSAHAAIQRGGSDSERFYHAFRGFLIAGILFFLLLICNYVLVSTCLQRLIMSERIGYKDSIASFCFAWSAVRINNLWALVIVLFSFSCSAVFLLGLNGFVSAVRNRLWTTDMVGFLLCVGTLLFWGFAAGVCLYFDTGLMLFRTASLIWSYKYAVSGGSLPDPITMIAENKHTMGAFLLSVLGIWYPIIILEAEINMASSYSALVEASKQIFASREQARQTEQLPLVTEAPPPVLAPAAGIDPDLGAPGGATEWVRPIPFNTDIRNDGNGVHPNGG